MPPDFREDDVEILQKHGLSDGEFGQIWEEELHEVHTEDYLQERWHLSRMSMLAGYLLGQGKDIEEILSVLAEHRDRGEDQ